MPRRTTRNIQDALTRHQPGAPAARGTLKPITNKTLWLSQLDEAIDKLMRAKDHLIQCEKLFIGTPPPSIKRQIAAFIPGLAWEIFAYSWALPSLLPDASEEKNSTVRHLIVKALIAQTPALLHIATQHIAKVTHFSLTDKKMLVKQALNIILRSGLVTFGVQSGFGGFLMGIGVPHEVATPIARVMSTIILAKEMNSLIGSFTLGGKEKLRVIDEKLTTKITELRACRDEINTNNSPITEERFTTYEAQIGKLTQEAAKLISQSKQQIKQLLDFSKTQYKRAEKKFDEPAGHDTQEGYNTFNPVYVV